MKKLFFIDLQGLARFKERLCAVFKDEIADEERARSGADNALGVRIDEETNARAEADSALGGRIDAEANARAEAESALEGCINGEAWARSEADSALGGRIDAEANARAEADSALGGRIDGEETARTHADNALGVRIDEEASARAEADSDLKEKMDVLNGDEETEGSVDRKIKDALDGIEESGVRAENPVFTGSFSQNRKAGSEIGAHSHAEGANTTASGGCSHAEGANTVASDFYTHAEGTETVASDDCAHAEGCRTVASRYAAHAEGGETEAAESYAHAEGLMTTAQGCGSHAEGMSVKAAGHYSHAEGEETIAAGRASHVQGVCNVEDTSNTYADIVGGGEKDSYGKTTRKNIEATTWTGDKRLKGDVFLHCEDDSSGGVSVTDALDGKVDKVEGMGLSEQNFTRDDKAKLMNLSNYDDGELVMKVSETSEAVKVLNGDEETEGSVDRKIKDALKGIAGFDFRIVDALPESGDKGAVYLVPLEDGGEGDLYEEHIWISGRWELMGKKSVSIDLAEYAKNADVEEADSVLQEKIDVLNGDEETEGSVDRKIKDALDGLGTGGGGGVSAENPVFTGSFSQNRKPGSEIGANSHAEGANTEASGSYSHAEGVSTVAKGLASHAEGANTGAKGSYSHAEGYVTEASGAYSHAEGSYTKASGPYSHAEGASTVAKGSYSHAEGNYAVAKGSYSHAEGYDTQASGSYSHVQGKLNVQDMSDIYADIVGGGEKGRNGKITRKNIEATTWTGDKRLKGDVFLHCEDDSSGGVSVMGLIEALQQDVAAIKGRLGIE